MEGAAKMSEALLHPDDDLQDGETLSDGRFRITGLVGLGATGVIYTARDCKLDREVALKLLARRCVGVPDREARFDRESTIGLTLPEHPNLVRVLDAGRIDPPDERPWLALEYVRGPTLAQLRSRQELDDRRLAKLMLDVARGLATLHDSGIVHRDLKPANVLVQTSGDELAKIADLGLAVRAESSNASRGDVTRADQRPGTINYMAPEQIGGVSASPTIDVYALGATFYEVVVGRPPYNDVSADEMARLKLEGVGPEPSIRDARPDLSAGLAEIIEDCMRFDAAQRPTAATVVERLERLLGVPPERRQGRRNTMWLVAAAGVALAIWGIASIPNEPDPQERSEPPRGSGASQASMSAVGSGSGSLEHESPEQGSKTPPAPSKSTPSDAEESESAPPSADGSLQEDEGGAATPTDATAPSKPKPDRPPKPPSTTKPEKPAPEVGDPPEPEHDCAEVQAAAKAALNAGRWKDVLRETKNKACFPRRADRAALRVRAHAELRHWPECIREGADLSDTEIKTWVDLCRKKAME